MSDVKKIVNTAFVKLLSDLESGDEIIVGGSYDRSYKTSKKTGDARVAFLETVRQKLIAKELTTDEANQATQMFGRKTTNLFWCKNKSHE